MDLQSEKKNIADTLQELTGKDYIKKKSRIYQGMRSLQRDMEGDFYTVVVLGEFKRGKSTLVNALLGNGLLPMNVLPETATINAIMYAEEPRLSVMYRDGTERKGEVSEEFLRQYSARDAQEEAGKVGYIKIGYPCDILKNRVVLVDTPGVSDLNEHRSEVTYQFLPRANAVLFVLDANSPLKKTERDFIVERLLPLGITNILFIVNKYDAVDDEEEDDFLPTVRKRLIHALQTDEGAALDNVTLLPFSAKWALEGQQKQNEKMVKLSGLAEVRGKLGEMLLDNRVEQTKIMSYRNRLYNSLNGLERELENERSMQSASATELEAAADTLRQALEEKAGREAKVADYVKAAKAHIYALTDKSLQYFHKKLKSNILEMVAQYRQQNFKSFIEQTIPRQVQRNIEGWVASYTPHVDELLSVMEHELALGLSRHFEQHVRLKTKAGAGMVGTDIGLTLEAADISKTSLQTGAIVAAGAVAANIILSPVIVPFLTLWGREKLFGELLTKKLETAKEEVVPQIESELAKAMLNLTAHVHDYIDKRAEDIHQNTESAYATLLEDLRRNVEIQVAEKRSQGEAVQQKLSELMLQIQEIKMYEEKLLVKEKL